MGGVPAGREERAREEAREVPPSSTVTSSSDTTLCPSPSDPLRLIRPRRSRATCLASLAGNLMRRTPSPELSPVVDLCQLLDLLLGILDLLLDPLLGDAWYVLIVLLLALLLLAPGAALSPGVGRVGVLEPEDELPPYMRDTARKEECEGDTARKEECV
ncbi:MAG: hypothetical protein QW356_05540 [Candidatus Hadarchaeales archaeon]